MSYRVLVNGEVLETLRFPVRPRDTLFAPNGGNQYEAGESDLVYAPPYTSSTVSSLESPTFARGHALLFAAYRGNAGPPTFFTGLLDEWRFWNGARTPTAIKVLLCSSPPPPMLCSSVRAIRPRRAALLASNETERGAGA